MSPAMCYVLCNECMQEAIMGAEAGNFEEVELICTRLVCREADGALAFRSLQKSLFLSMPCSLLRSIAI